MLAHQLTVDDYQDLVNRGWRRSGTWLYRPLAEESECSCVPHTIRLDVHKFAPSRVSVVKSLAAVQGRHIKGINIY